MAKRKFWLDFEKFIGSRLPKDIPNILTACGYDSELAIIGLKEKDLETIEKEVDKNKDILKNSTDYKNNYNSPERFVLKPGHKSLILSLPKKFEDFLEEKKKDEQRNNPKKNSKNVNELKSELTEKLNNYMLRFSFNVNFTQSDLSKFIFLEDKNCYTCGVKCPFCMKVFSCKYSTYWMVSNFEAHLKSHVNQAKSLQKSVTIEDPGKI